MQRNKKKRRFCILFQPLIQTTPKPCLLISKPWKTSDRMRNTLKKVKFINCEQQAPSVGNILCKSSFSPSNSISGVKNCGKSLVWCQHIKEGIEHTIKTVDKKFEIRVPFNCESENLIYVVICSGCKEKYIGQTQTMFKEPKGNIFDNPNYSK